MVASDDDGLPEADGGPPQTACGGVTLVAPDHAEALAAVIVRELEALVRLPSGTDRVRPVVDPAAAIA